MTLKKLTVRLPQDLHGVIEHNSIWEHMTVSAYIRTLLLNSPVDFNVLKLFGMVSMSGAGSPMIRITVYLPADICNKIAGQAVRYSTSKSEVVRALLNRLTDGLAVRPPVEALHTIELPTYVIDTIRALAHRNQMTTSDCMRALLLVGMENLLVTGVFAKQGKA